MIAGRFPRSLREAFQCADAQIHAPRASRMHGAFAEPLGYRLRRWMRMLWR
jgi:hypothetical protein